MKARPPERATRIAGCLLLITAFFLSCGSNVRQVMDQAEASWRKGRYPEAVRANEEVYRREPRGRYAARALLNIGNIQYLNQRQLKPAIGSFNKLVREFPDGAEAIEAHRQLAEIYANEIIDLDQAIAQYDELLKLHDLEDRSNILFQRADLYFKKEDFDRALREFRALEDTRLDDHLADQISLKIGDIYQIQKKFDWAVEPFGKAIRSKWPECRRRAILSLAETYENLFEFDKAIEMIGRLDRTQENESVIASETERLKKKQKEVNRGGGLNFKPLSEVDPLQTKPKPVTKKR
jgi:tetratricopeptide (TPR) repeat protein